LAVGRFVSILVITCREFRICAPGRLDVSLAPDLYPADPSPVFVPPVDEDRDARIGFEVPDARQLASSFRLSIDRRHKVTRCPNRETHGHCMRCALKRDAC
jgi:hypothetical protein